MHTKELNSIFFIFLLFIATALFADTQLPERPQSWVSDYANILSANQETQLNGMLSGLEQRSSNQVFVAIMSDIPDGEYLEDYTTKLFEKWRPGLADKNNGILIAIFINNRKIRIEVGYGLEDVLTDAQSNTLIQGILRPHFKQGKYYEGIKATLEVLIPAVEGKYKIPVAKKSQKKTSPFSGIVALIIILAILSRFFGGGSTGYGTRKRGGSILGPMIIGSMLGGSSRGGSFGGGGGGFSGGFGGLSGGGGASGGW